jgi:hypothetical protein
LQWTGQCHAAEYFYQKKKKNKGKNWTLEVRREFDSKGKEKEIYCQSEQFTRFNLPHYFIFERNTQAQKTVSFFQYLEISRLEIHHYVFLVSQPCFFPTGHHKDLQQSECLPIYCGKNTKNIRYKLRRLHNRKTLIVVIITICIFPLKATNLCQFNRSAHKIAEKMAVKSNASGENMET